MHAFIAALSGLAIGAMAAPGSKTTPSSTVHWTTMTSGGVTWTQPVSPSSRPTGPSNCMSAAEASTVANNFRDTIAKPFSTPEAEANFASNFQDYSDSVNELIDSGCPSGPVALGSATFSSRAAFIAGQSGQAPIPFTILNLWYTCTTVHFRWRSSPGPGFVQPEEQVTGIIAIEAVKNTDPNAASPWLIQTVYSEFNSGAWLYDIHNFTPTCTTGSKPKGRSVALL